MLLEVQDLRVQYDGLTALDAVTLHVDDGEFVGLIGPNGAGKTTFVDAVTGLTSSTGEVRLDGVRLDGASAHQRSRRGIARTFQSLELFEELTVMENLAVAASTPRWYSWMADLVRPRRPVGWGGTVDEVAELLELGRHLEAFPRELSLGQRKLVTVARALCAAPRLVLLDEPAAGLDSAESLELGAKLRSVVARGTAILMIDHDMGLVLSVCDRIHVLEFGRHIASGTPTEIRGDTAVVSAYLGAGAETELA